MLTTARLTPPEPAVCLMVFSSSIELVSCSGETKNRREGRKKKPRRETFINVKSDNMLKNGALIREFIPIYGWQERSGRISIHSISVKLFQCFLKSKDEGLGCCRSKYKWDELCPWRYAPLPFPCAYVGKSLGIFPSAFLSLRIPVHLHSILYILFFLIF